MHLDPQLLWKKSCDRVRVGMALRRKCAPFAAIARLVASLAYRSSAIYEVLQACY